MVITPLLLTFSIASATSCPTASSLRRLQLLLRCAPCRLLLAHLTDGFYCTCGCFLHTFSQMMGLAPAARFFIPAFTIACARTVAVVVPSPATSLVLVATSFTSCAPMFSNASSSSISFAMVTPSLVIRGAPKDLSSTTFLPLGPKVTLTVSASWLTPASNAARLLRRI